MNYSLLQETFISDVDKSRIESAEIAFNVWYYVFLVGAIVSIIMSIVALPLLFSFRESMGTNVLLLAVSGLLLFVLFYFGTLFLMKYIWNSLKNNALQTQDDKKAHKYTVLAIVFVSFLLFILFLNIVFSIVNESKRVDDFGTNIKGLTKSFSKSLKRSMSRK